MKPISSIAARLALAGAAIALQATAPSAQTILTNSDGVIRNSLCIGFDCPNSVTFNADTIRLQENNLRIHFEDTSTLAGFPTNDWRIEINSAASGGTSHFAVQDVSNNRFPFTIRAGARANALFVDSAGRVGLGTATPVLELHVVDGDSPSLRLEQNNSSGFTPQTWDVAGNETSFFIRDATGGSKLPFRIRPGAPSSSIDIASTGNVGLNTSAPSQALHLRRTNGTAQLLVEETGAVNSSTLFRLTSNARPIFEFENTSVAASQGIWRFSTANNGDLEINNVGVSGAIPVEFDLASNGNLTLSGTIAAPSSRLFKAGIADVDAAEILSRIDAMPIVTWHYLNQSPEEVHIGPVAEDFYAAFGLGTDERLIALNDLSGVALAGVKGLIEELRARDAAMAARLAAQDAEIEALKAALAAR